MRCKSTSNLTLSLHETLRSAANTLRIAHFQMRIVSSDLLAQAFSQQGANFVQYTCPLLSQFICQTAWLRKWFEDHWMSILVLQKCRCTMAPFTIYTIFHLHKMQPAKLTSRGARPRWPQQKFTETQTRGLCHPNWCKLARLSDVLPGSFGYVQR